MNKKRRKELSKVITTIENLVQDILNEEEESFDNMPENLQNSIRAMESEESQDLLNSVIDSLEEAISYLEEI